MTKTKGAAAPPALTEAEIATLATNGIDATESDNDYEARIAAERAEFDRIRELTPVQELELRPCPGTSHMGAIIGSPDGVRCVSLADWRTDRLVLRAGDTCQLVVLAGEGLKMWEHYRWMEARAKEQPPLGAEVKTVPVGNEVAAGLVDRLVGPSAVDPLEETQPAIGETIPPAGETKAAEADTPATNA